MRILICGFGAAPVPSTTVTSEMRTTAGLAGGRGPRCAPAVDAAAASDSVRSPIRGCMASLLVEGRASNK
jgi:hypothetical protein